MKMHPLTLTFEDPEVEASFDAAHRERGARRVRGIILVFCGALLLSIGFDVSAVPHLWHFSLIFKLGLAIPGLLIVAALSRKPFFVRHFNGAVLIGSVILGAAVLFPMYLVAPEEMSRSFLWGWLVAAVATTLCTGLRLP